MDTGEKIDSLVIGPVKVGYLHAGILNLDHISYYILNASQMDQKSKC